MTTKRVWVALCCAALVSMSMSACGGSRTSVVPSSIDSCNTTKPTSSATRAVRDVAWYPSGTPDPTLQYAVDGQRQADAGDTDLIGAGGGGRIYQASGTCGQSSARKTSGITWIPTQCWYQARTAGIHDTTVDWFLGCDYVAIDTGGNIGGFIGGGTGGIGVRQGIPNQDAPACSGAPQVVSDDIPDGNGGWTSIKDVNSLWNGNQETGWMYLGTNGTTYIQYNYANSAGKSFAISAGALGVGISTPGGYSGIYKWNGSWQPGTHSRKCFSRGKQLGPAGGN